MLVLASADLVAGITAGATLLAALGLAIVTVLTKRHDLENARELADLADLRVLLDQAAVALDKARQPFNKAVAIVRPRPIQYSVGKASELVDALVSDIEDHVLLQTLAVRLAVRLGDDHPITAEFRRASQAMHLLWRTFAEKYDPAEPLSAKGSDVAIAHAAFIKAGTAFLAAAVDRAGTVPTKGGRMTA
jgi:hypothetical protein